MEIKKQNCNELKSEIMPRAVKLQVSIVSVRLEVPRAVPHHSQEERKKSTATIAHGTLNSVH